MTFIIYDEVEGVMRFVTIKNSPVLDHTRFIPYVPRSVLDALAILKDYEEGETDQDRKQQAVREMMEYMYRVLQPIDDDPMPDLFTEWYRIMRDPRAEIYNPQVQSVAYSTAAGCLLREGFEQMLSFRAYQFLHRIVRVALEERETEDRRETARYLVTLCLDVPNTRLSPIRELSNETREYFRSVGNGEVVAPPVKAVLTPFDTPLMPSFPDGGHLPLDVRKKPLHKRINDEGWWFHALDRLNFINHSRNLNETITGEEIVKMAEEMIRLPMEKLGWGFVAPLRQEDLSKLDDIAVSILIGCDK